MGGFIKDVAFRYRIRGMANKDLLRSPLHLSSIYPLGDGNLFAFGGIDGGAEIITGTREDAEPIWPAPVIHSFYCNVACQDKGCISRSVTKEQS